MRWLCMCVCVCVYVMYTFSGDNSNSEARRSRRRRNDCVIIDVDNVCPTAPLLFVTPPPWLPQLPQCHGVAGTCPAPAPALPFFAHCAVFFWAERLTFLCALHYDYSPTVIF